MDIERAVDEFISRGKHLFYDLRAQGDSVSYLGLHTLLVQLHILRSEAERLEHIKRVALRSLGKLKSPDECEHHRLIDKCTDANGQLAEYCLECGAIIQDPPRRSET